ncbi:MAG: chemotaxis protein CheW [Vicinamibacterales bacterium]
MTGDIVTCVISGAQYALGGRHIREIVRGEHMRRDGRPDDAAGVVTVDGAKIPVHSLASILTRHAGAGEAPQTAGRHIIVTQTSRGAVGWLVDRIARSKLPADTQVTPLPPMLGRPATSWFEGLLRVEDRSLLLLSPEHLDPRAASAPPDRDECLLMSPPARTTVPRGGIPAGLVVTFSSPALPRCSAPRYALSARRVAVVVRSLPVCMVPGSARFIVGVTFWRGEALPVIDFRDAADRDATSDAHRFLVARCGGPMSGTSVAFSVDAEMALHQPTRDDRAADDDVGFVPPFVAGMFDVGGNRLALLDLDALLGAVPPEIRQSAGHQDC